MKLLLPAALAVLAILREVCGNKDGTECEQRTEDGKCCVFPFKFMGEKMHFCISGGPSEDDWCATTDDFDRDGEWGRCTGVKCYICSSDVSWSDCENQQQAHNCPYMHDQCLTLSKEAGVTNTSLLFLKRCTSNTQCTAYNPTCDRPDVLKCDFSCCMGDFCNAASLPYSAVDSFVHMAAWIFYMYG